jgi:hypothetical protein
MNRRTPLGFALLSALALGACSDLQEGLAPTDDLLTTAAELNDGSTGGFAGFYFEPPLAPSQTFEGDFNPDLSPSILVCPIDESTWDGTSYPSGRDVCMTRGPNIDWVLEVGPDEITVWEDRYEYGWNTTKQNDGAFRVFVTSEQLVTGDGTVSDVDLGYRDVYGAPPNGGGPVNAGEFYEFQAGSSLPVKFRIEGGVFCGAAIFGGEYVDCAEANLGTDNNFQTGITTPEAKANVVVCAEDITPGDDIDDTCTPVTLPEQDVTILVYRVENEVDGVPGPEDSNWGNGDPLGLKCIDELDLPQAGDPTSGCYRVSVLTPNFTQIVAGKRAFVSLCIDETSFPLLGGAALPEQQENAMMMFKEGEDGTISRLDLVASYLPVCPTNINDPTTGTTYFDQLDESASPFKKMFYRTLDAVHNIATRAVEPEPARARLFLHGGRGGELREFSLFTVALDGTFSSTGSYVLAPPGSTVDAGIDFTGESDEGGVTVQFGVPDVRVRFSIPSESEDGGTITSGSQVGDDSGNEVFVFTDADGNASLDAWTLGTTPGNYYVDAEIQGACPADYEGVCEADPVTGDWPKVRFTATVCSPYSGIGSATVDGVIGDVEWTCAYTLPFTASLSGGDAPAEWKWMSDGQNLYMAVQVARDPDDKKNTLRIDFDNDGDGSSSQGDNIVEIEFDTPMGPNGQLLDKTLSQKCVKNGQSGCGALDADQDGYGLFLPGTITLMDGVPQSGFVYEFSFPLDSADDWGGSNPAGSGVVRAFLTLAGGEGAQGNTQVPQFRDFRCTVLGGTLSCGTYHQPPTP